MKPINPKVVYSNVKILRERKQMSQKQLAEAVGMDHRTYSNNERIAPKSIDLDLIQKFSNILECDIEDLTSGEVPEESLISDEVRTFWINEKKRRQELGLSIKEVAEKLGMSMQNLQAKEALRSPKLPSVLVQQISEILQITVDELKTGEVNKIPEQKIIVETKEMPINNNAADLSHLAGFVREFILDKNNASILADLIYEYQMNNRK